MSTEREICTVKYRTEVFLICTVKYRTEASAASKVQGRRHRGVGGGGYSPPPINLVARARDPLWEESWGSGKKPERMHGIHCIPFLSDPVH